MANGGSKVLTAVISFLLGFLFALIVEIGAIFGVYYFVTNSDLETIFNTLGIQNKDENGDFVYLNTDSENGGAKNLAELLDQLHGYLYSEGSDQMDFPVLGKSLSDISNLIPMVQRTISESLYPMVENFIDVDWETFESTPLNSLPQFLSDSMMDIRPAALLEKMGMSGLVGDDANPLVNALLAGAEFDYASYGNTSLKFPVYIDNYVYSDELSSFYRVESVNGTQAYPTNLDTDLLYDSGTVDENGDRIYQLFFVPCTYNGATPSDALLAENGELIYNSNTTFFAVKYNEAEDKYVFNTGANYLYLQEYGLHHIDRTGNYYYNNAGTELQIYPVTIGSFSDPDEVFKPLYGVRITELMAGDVITALFGRHSVGELIDNKIDIDECVNNLELADVIAIDPTDTLMAYIGYGITNVQPADGHGDYQYTATVKVDGVPTPCYVHTELVGEPARRTVVRIWYNEVDSFGRVQQVDVKGTTVSSVSDIATTMDMSALIEVKASDAVLSYIGYGLYDVAPKDGDGYNYVGKCDLITDGGTREVDAFIQTDADDKIINVWYEEDGESVFIGGTTVEMVSDRIETLTDRLTLLYVLENVDVNDAVLCYIGYGLYDVSPKAGEGYDHVAKCDVLTGDGTREVDAFIKTDSEGMIVSAWYMDGGEEVAIGGTPINMASNRVSSLTDKLTLLYVLSEVDVDDAVLSYIGYGLYDIAPKAGDGYDHVAKCDVLTEEGTQTVDAFIKTDSEGMIVSVWYIDGGEEVAIGGTPINKVSERVSSLTDKLTLLYVLSEVDVDDAVLCYIGYGLYDVSPKAGNGYDHVAKCDVLTDDGVKEVTAYISTTENNISEVWYEENGEKIAIGGTPIKRVSDRISSLTDKLTLLYVLDGVDASDAVLCYVGYGLYDVAPKAGEGYDYVAKCDVLTDDGSRAVDAFIKADGNGVITEVWYEENGEKIAIGGTPINRVSDRISSLTDRLTLLFVMDVNADDAIICYIGYGLYGVVPQDGTDCDYVGKCDIFVDESAQADEKTRAVDAFINVDGDGVITEVWYEEDGEKIAIGGTPINRVSDRISSLTDRLALSDVLTVTVDQKITMYIGYGITKVEEVSGEEYTHKGLYTVQVAGDTREETAYIIADSEGKIVSAWYMNGGVKVNIAGTPIGDVPVMVEGIADNLALGDVLEIDPINDKILYALKDVKISKIGSEVGNLKLGDVIEDVGDSAILGQLANTSINDLATAVDGITIQSIYAKEIYGIEEGVAVEPHQASEYDETVLYYELVDGSYKFVHEGEGGDKVGRLTSEEFNAGTFYTYGKAQGMWRLILTSSDGGAGGAAKPHEKAYTLNNLDEMIVNSASNVYTATLKELQDAGIINSQIDLNVQFVLDRSLTLGDITLEKLITTVATTTSILP